MTSIESTLNERSNRPDNNANDMLNACDRFRNLNFIDTVKCTSVFVAKIPL